MHLLISIVMSSQQDQSLIPGVTQYCVIKESRFGQLKYTEIHQTSVLHLLGHFVLRDTGTANTVPRACPLARHAKNTRIQF